MIHALVFGAAARLAARNGVGPSSEPTLAPTELVVEVVRDPELARDPHDRATSGASVTSAGSSQGGASNAKASPRTNVGSAGGEPESAAVATAVLESGEPASGSGWSLPGSRSGPVALGDLVGPRGIPIAPPGPGTVAEAAPAQGVSRTGGLVEGLDQADVAKGQGRGGAVLASVEVAARSNDAPATGRAIFDVTVGRDNVVNVSILDASSDRGGWERLSAAITEGLRNKRTRIPSGANALKVRVQIEATMKFPDGRDARGLGSGVDPKTLSLGVQGKVCGVGLTPLGIGGGCSPENTGVVAARVVEGRIVSESRL